MVAVEAALLVEISGIREEEIMAETSKKSVVQNDPLMNAKELAEYLHVSRSWIYQQAASRYPAFHLFRVAGRVMARYSAVAEYLAKCETL
jgi:hypothetical protein